MYLEDSKFEKLIVTVSEIEKKVNSLVNKKKVFGDDDQPLDNQDVCSILEVTNRTLQRYRSDGTLPFTKPKHKIYYRMSDIRDYLTKQGDQWKIKAFEKKYGSKGE